MINHEVVAENLHAELSIVLVDFLPDTHHCRFYYREHLIFEKLVEIHLQVVLLPQVVGTLFERENVALFELPIVLAMLLNRIVRQVHKEVVSFVQIVLLT